MKKNQINVLELSGSIQKLWVYQWTLEWRRYSTKLYAEVIASFKAEKVCLKNVIGFASDGWNTMMGAWNSVASKFLEDFPSVMIQKCICHSLTLCAPVKNVKYFHAD